jgi:hypothetical protein
MRRGDGCLPRLPLKRRPDLVEEGGGGGFWACGQLDVVCGQCDSLAAEAADIPEAERQ